MGLGGAQKDRIESRVRTMVRARLRDTAGEREFCIIDVSSRGILATAARPPKRGEFVEISLGNNFLTAQVKWASERRFGLGLRERVSVTAMVEGGKGRVALQGSAATARRSAGMWQALSDNPQMLGKAAQMGGLLAAAAAAAWLVSDIVGSSLAPISEAVSVMNVSAD